MIESAQNDSVSTPLVGDAAQPHLRNRIKEHERLISLLDMLHKGDALDHKILHVINQVLKEAPTAGKVTTIDADQVEDTLLSLPTIEDILAPTFFARLPLSFRVLRRFLELHSVNPVSDKEMTSVPLSKVDRDNVRLMKRVWFLLLIGTPPHETAHTLLEYRVSRLISPAP